MNLKRQERLIEEDQKVGIETRTQSRMEERTPTTSLTEVALSVEIKADMFNHGLKENHTATPLVTS